MFSAMEVCRMEHRCRVEMEKCEKTKGKKYLLESGPANKIVKGEGGGGVFLSFFFLR